MCYDNSVPQPLLPNQNKQASSAAYYFKFLLEVGINRVGANNHRL